MEEMKFKTFEEFLTKFPLNEISVPVAIQSPEEPGSYWLIRLALPMKNKVITCCIDKAGVRDIYKYKVLSLRLIKQEIGLNATSDKREKFRNRRKL